MHLRENAKKLNDSIDTKLMETLCRQYISALKNVKQKARTHALDIKEDKDLLFVLIFVASFESLDVSEQRFINDAYFYQTKSKHDKSNGSCIDKFIELVRGQYEFI